MAPQIQRARAALRAIHRMDTLMRASHEAQADVEAGQQPAEVPQSNGDSLQRPLLETDRTPEEAAAADFRTTRSESKAVDGGLCHSDVYTKDIIALLVPVAVPLHSSKLNVSPQGCGCSACS